ncbi:MAG: dihydroorotase [Chitinophagaceae bacterium]|nr:dihydroorotase [Chitinophagaceae bacterium]
MKQSILIKNATVVNEGQIFEADVFIHNEFIEAIRPQLDVTKKASLIIDAGGKYLFPGVIDAHVHFREPGLTHKGDLHSETKAAIAGGITSFIDMPNTLPNVLTTAVLNDKFRIASQKSLANYAFFLGINSCNIDEVIKMDISNLIGVSDDGLYFTKKGNLLADNPETMEKLFAICKSIIAIHSENEQIIEENETIYRTKYGENVPAEFHPVIRSEEACYQSTRRAVELAKKHQARLHILHLSTEAETHLFRNDLPLKNKTITTEVSIHHLWFSDKDYQRLGNLIKWNPAIKTEKDRAGLLKALLDDRIDIITSDHAPHTLDEKQMPYFRSVPGAPMVQHSLNIMLELYREGHISLEKIAEKMCHNPAILYSIQKRGFIREGYFADLTLVDLHVPWTVTKENILYKCGWSPLEGMQFKAQVTHTFVNGFLVYDQGQFDETPRGLPLSGRNIF